MKIYIQGAPISAMAWTNSPIGACRFFQILMFHPSQICFVLILTFKILHWNIIYLDYKLFWGEFPKKTLHSKRRPWFTAWSWLWIWGSSSTFLSLFLLLRCLQDLWACLVAQISTENGFLFVLLFLPCWAACGDLHSLTRDGTCAPCSRRKLRVFNHWTTRKISRENVLRRGISRQKLSCLEWPILGRSTSRPSCRPRLHLLLREGQGPWKLWWSYMSQPFFLFCKFTLPQGLLESENAWVQATEARLSQRRGLGSYF